GNIKVEVVFENGTFWLTQKAMAMLFNVKRPAITKHLLKIFETKELEENSVSSILEHTEEKQLFPNWK
ncbi:MAG: DNA-binding protein, partial [Bacteroidia bacterium]|nr:DNA-binding protein [Bacteroidia bacterium]